ncbi:MAG TPA: glycoside hydrolase family 125 protein [Candidatus Eremiobacteraceae bacterium]|nr:glycoside hydrolase family 125 protein [Candidatus Eremiobacteraceae bacterium]
MTLLHRQACALVISLAVLSSPSRAFGADGPAVQFIIIPSSAINPDTIVIPASNVFQTLTADFFREDDGTEYVQTGDIPAMWLRDSSAQTKPYVRFTAEHPEAAPLVRAVIERNAKNVLTDPYANAFTAGYKVWEEKWEVDSLAYPITLAYTYWRRTGDRALFTQRLHWAWQHTISTLTCEQHHATCSHYRSRYLMSGRGSDFAYTGMIWSAFRPSDDPVRYSYNVPQNMFVVVALRELTEMALSGYGDARLATQASRLADEVDSGIQRYGAVYDMDFGWVYAYEVDGMGHTLLMDDANVPNLIGATYYGYVAPGSQIYANTRRLALSPANPYYYSGKYATGLGSPHTPTGWVWPLGLIVRGVTSDSPADTLSSIRVVTSTMHGEALFHESFDPDNPERFTRTSFGWAEAAFAELIFRSAAGFDPDPLPAPVAELGYQNDIQRTPLVVAPPQLWLNQDTCFNAVTRLLQE